MNPVRDLSLMFYNYIIQSQKSRYLYTGVTNDLRKRFKQHNEGKSTWTKKRGPWNLVYYEACLNEEDARSREKYLKTGLSAKEINPALGILEIRGILKSSGGEIYPVRNF